MRRFDRLRKTVRHIARNFGHELGVWQYLEDPNNEHVRVHGALHVAYCLHCHAEAYIFTERKVNMVYDVAGSPNRTFPAEYAKMMKEVLGEDMYPKNGVGYVAGTVLLQGCIEGRIINYKLLDEFYEAPKLLQQKNRDRIILLP